MVFIQYTLVQHNARWSKSCIIVTELVSFKQGWRQEFSDGGLTLLTRALKYRFQGAINAKNLRKKSLFTFQRGAIAP